MDGLGDHPSRQDHRFGGVRGRWPTGRHDRTNAGDGCPARRPARRSRQCLRPGLRIGAGAVRDARHGCHDGSRVASAARRLASRARVDGQPGHHPPGHAHHRRGLADGQSAREAALRLPNHAVRTRPAIPARPRFAASHARRCGWLDDASRCAQAEVGHRQRPAHGARRFAELDRNRRGRHFPRRIERRRP